MQVTKTILVGGQDPEHVFMQCLTETLRQLAGESGTAGDGPALVGVGAAGQAYFDNAVGYLILAAYPEVREPMTDEECTFLFTQLLGANAAAFAQRYLPNMEGFAADGTWSKTCVSEDVVTGFAVLAGLDGGAGELMLSKYILPEQGLGMEFVARLAEQLATGGQCIQMYSNSPPSHSAVLRCSMHTLITTAMQSLLKRLDKAAGSITDTGHRETFMEFCQVGLSFSN
jgi:hypothetical protein